MSTPRSITCWITDSSNSATSPRTLLRLRSRTLAASENRAVYIGRAPALLEARWWCEKSPASMLRRGPWCSSSLSRRRTRRLRSATTHEAPPQHLWRNFHVAARNRVVDEMPRSDPGEGGESVIEKTMGIAAPGEPITEPQGHRAESLKPIAGLVCRAHLHP